MKKHTQFIKLIITNQSNEFVGDPFYVAGNFNNWLPDALSPGAIPEPGVPVTFTLPIEKSGSLEFKITRGAWSNLSCTRSGKLEAPYVLEDGQPRSLNIELQAWRDRFPESTASPQVHLLSESFCFPKLSVFKRIWIYLPKGYERTTKHYPVIYMHDGQHLFDEATSSGRTGPVEWEVDETIDASQKDAIVIAIASADSVQGRKQEYLLHANEQESDPRGGAYLADIISTLKPFVDQRYRTLSGRESTAMVGSSLGGLVTLYAGLRYPEVFGNIGVFSPSIWMDDKTQLEKALETTLYANQNKQNYYLYGGQLEIREAPTAQPINMTENLQWLADFLRKDNRFQVEMDIHPQGKHGALYWKAVFPSFYAWWTKNLT